MYQKDNDKNITDFEPVEERDEVEVKVVIDLNKHKILSTGLNLKMEKLAEDPEKDHVFGGLHVNEIKIPPGTDLEKFLPEGELQRGVQDMMDCTARAVVNIIEIILNVAIKYKLISQQTIDWLMEKGYVVNSKASLSDAWIAQKAGNTKNGNSLKAPWQAAHTWGMIPKSMLPYDPKMTWDEYHDPDRITPEMEDLAKEFKKRLQINYEKVYKHIFDKIKTKVLIGVAGHAWSRNIINGVYQRVGSAINHAFVYFKLPRYKIFDNYLDRDVAGDWVKQLASDYILLQYGYRGLVTETKYWKTPDNVEVAVNNQTYPPGSWLSHYFWFWGVFKRIKGVFKK